MAKVRLDLTQFKASGVYTLEYDASESIILNSQIVRLIIGFSRKGPFNAPVYLPDKKTARLVFGDVDEFLERRGSFFHRSLMTALEYGPVFGLNLMKLNNNPENGDRVPYQSFSLATTEKNGKKVNALLASFYNKERFWYPDQEYLLGNVNSPDSPNKGKLFNIVNLGQTPVSLIVRKAKVLGLDVIARDWFGVGKVPSYINEWDFISDYFVDVIVVQGTWTNYQQLAIDPIYSKYFNTRGLIKAKMNDFFADESVNVLGSFTGSIIPDLVDGNGISHSIDVKINQQIAATGIFVAIDKNNLENYNVDANLDDNDQYSAVDVVGHNFADPTRVKPDIIDFMSYKTAIKDKISFDIVDDFTIFTADFDNSTGLKIKNDSIYKGGNSGYLNNVLKIKKPVDVNENDPNLIDYLTLKNLLISKHSLLKSDTKYFTIEQVWEDEEYGEMYLNILWSHPDKNDTTNDLTLAKDLTSINFDGLDPVLKLSYDTGDAVVDFTNKILIKNIIDNSYYYLPIKPVVIGDIDGVVDGGTSVTITIDTNEYNSESIEQILRNIDTNKTIYKVYTKSVLNYTVNDVTDDGEFIINPDKFQLGDGTTNSGIFTAYKGSKIYEYYTAGALQDGDIINYKIGSDNVTKGYLKFDIEKDDENIQVLKISVYNKYVNEKFGTQITGTIVMYNWDTTPATSDDALIVSVYADELYDDVTIISNSWNSYKNKFQVTTANNNLIEVGDYIVSEVTNDNGDKKYKLTKVITKQKIYNGSSYVFEYTVNQSIYIKDPSTASPKVTRYKALESFVKTYQMFSLEGFKLNDYHLPGGPNKKSQLWKILGMLDPVNSNLLETLKDRNVISFRYVVDTFDGGLDAMTGPKSWITRLAKERQKCLAIMNAPSMKEFADSIDPRFTELPTPENPKPILNTAYIADGGNLTLGPSYTFSLPDEFWGSKFSGYFTPFLVMRENGKNFNVPPAPWVSNLYVQKHNAGYPWAIVAGARRGVISDPKFVGVEYDFLLKDREMLEPMGLNPIIKKKGIGYMIFANAMAYQKTHSAFNNLHVRDLLITIEETIEDILSHYLFEFNDASTRLQIKTMVDSYLDNVRTQGGIYDYICVMDESNNTPEIIDQNVGIIDVAIEPARGLQKFVSRITVMKTGGVSGGGFSV